MFYTAEDIDPAVRLAEDIFGPSGTMMEGKNVKRNVVIGTPKFGKIWYGDIDGYIDSAVMLKELTTRMRSLTPKVDRNDPFFVIASDF